MMKPRIRPIPRRRAGPQSQHGLVLMLVLIVLGILALAGAAVMRSVDTGNTIAGNHSFQQSAMHASEQGMVAAMAALDNIVKSNTGNAAKTNVYYATRQTDLDDRGFPKNINWDNLPCRNEKGLEIEGSCKLDDGRFKVQYMIERRCTSNPDGTVQNLRAVCEHDVGISSAIVTSAAQIPVHYRIIVRVRGPRNSDSWYEAMVAGPV